MITTHPKATFPTRRPATIRLFKLAMAGIALTGCVAYGWQLLATGAIEHIGDTVTIRTGDYYWLLPFSFARALQWVAALLFLAFMAQEHPGKFTRRPHSWWPFLTAWTTLTFVLLLAYTQLSGTQVIMPFFLAMAILVSGGPAWLLARPGSPVTPMETWAGGLSACMDRPRTQVLTLALLTALSLAMGIVACRYIYQCNPLVTDSQSQIAQARLLLAGHWRLEISQALRDVIAFPYATKTVPSFSQYPPGHILLLLPVLAMGLPAQVLNIAAGAMAALLVMRLALKIFGTEAALVSGLLMATSPFILVMNGGAMNHVTTACLLMGTVICLVPTGPGQTLARSPWLAFIGGMCLGWATTTRPLTGLAHGIAWGGFALLLLFQGGWQWRKSRSDMPTAPHPLRTLGHGLMVTFGVAIPAAIFLFYNWKTTGNALIPGYLASDPELHRLGFRAGGPYPYSPIGALNNLVANGFSLNTLLLGWPIGSLAAMVLWLIRTRLGLPERLLIALIAVQTGLYALYHFHDLFLGPRFLFEIAPLLILLAAGGLASILKARDFKAGLLWILILIMSACGGITGLDWWQVKHNAAIAQHEAVEQFMRKTLPLDLDSVIVMHEPSEEMIGRHFSAPVPGRPTLWFVPEKKEAQARMLPELQSFQWLYFSQKTEMAQDRQPNGTVK